MVFRTLFPEERGNFELPTVLLFCDFNYRGKKLFSFLIILISSFLDSSDLMSVRFLDYGREWSLKEDSCHQDDLTFDCFFSSQLVRLSPNYPSSTIVVAWSFQLRLTDVLRITFPNRWLVVRCVRIYFFHLILTGIYTNRFLTVALVCIQSQLIVTLFLWGIVPFLA